jgi:hypothetical protein
VERRRTIRRSLAMLVLLAGALFIGHRFFGLFKAGPVAVEIHYQLGDPPVASHLTVDAYEHHFDTYIVSPDVVEKTRYPAGDRTLTITLDDKKTVTRTIEARSGAVITIDLTREVL